MFRKELIAGLGNQLVSDEYNEIEQKKSRAMSEFLPTTVEFVNRNIVMDRVLDIGCGGGLGFGVFPITHAIEPCTIRRTLAGTKHCGVEIISGYAENIPYPDYHFNTVIMLDTFDQVRSTIETVAEVNRVLKKTGVFIFDCQVDDSRDINYGLVYGLNNLRRYLEDFGFQAQEVRQINRRGLFAMVKVFNWSPLMVRKLQLIKIGDNWVARNFHPEEEYHRKYL